ncbi:TPA: fimbrial protein [Photobacterium damselae]
MSLLNKNNAIITITAGMVLASSSAFAATASSGEGIVRFQGSVIAAPCSIAPESVDQTIDFGQLSKAHLDAGGISQKKILNIDLLNCTVDASGATKNTVQVTFSGDSGTADDELPTSGGTNTSIVINGYGENVTYGTPTPAVTFLNGSNTLTFDTWAKMATGSTEVNTGEFTAVSNFILTYA